MYLLDAAKQSKYPNIKDDEIIYIVGKSSETTAKARIESK